MLTWPLLFLCVSDPRLEEALAGHAASLAALNTMHCKLTVNIWNPDRTNEIPAEFWKAGEVIRIERTEYGLKSTHIFNADGVNYALGSNPHAYDGISLSLVISPAKSDLIRLSHPNAWSRALLYYPGANQKWESLAELMAGSPRMSATQVQEAGRDCIKLRTQHERAQVTIWLSRAHGYLPCKVEYRFAPPHNVTMMGVVPAFTEVRPGVFFPESVEVKYLDDQGTQKSTIHTTFSEVTLAAAPAELFDPARLFVPNCLVWDKPNHKRYTLDAEGNKTNVVFEDFTPVEMMPKQPYTAKAVSPPPSHDWYRWLLYGSLLTLLVGGGLYLLDRRRKATVSSSS